MVLRHDHTVGAEDLRRPEEGAEVPRILHLVEGEEEGRLAATLRDLEQLGEVRVLGRRDARDDALVAVRARDRRELLARAEGDLDAGTARERDDLGERPPRAGQHGDLAGALAAAPEQLEPRDAAADPALRRHRLTRPSA